MIDFLKGWVINIVTLTMFIVLLEILLPKGKTKKFVNLVSGFVLLIAIINPFISKLKKGIDLKEFQFTASNFIDKQDIEKSSKVIQDTQMKQIVEVYRNKLTNQIIEAAKAETGGGEIKAEIIINEDYKADNFGEVKRVYLYLGEQKGDSEIKAVAKVEKIQIGGESTGQDEKLLKHVIDSSLREKLEDRINKLTGVQRENIVISLQED